MGEELQNKKGALQKDGEGGDVLMFKNIFFEKISTLPQNQNDDQEMYQTIFTPTVNTHNSFEEDEEEELEVEEQNQSGNKKIEGKDQEEQEDDEEQFTSQEDS